METNMKPFNLQEALAGKPVVTRMGDKVTGFHVFPAATYQRVFAVLRGDIISLNERGQYWNNGTEADNDLFMASEKKEGYVAVGQMPSPTSCLAFCSHVWPTEEGARQSYESAADLKLYSVQKISWEE